MRTFSEWRDEDTSLRVSFHPNYRHTMNAIRDVLASLLLLLCCDVVAAADAVPPPPSASPLPVQTYRIGVDDRVQVSVWRNPELSATVPVRPDGKISLPLVGDVPAGGRTAEEVAADVKQRLETFIRDPQVAVILTDLRSNEYLS